MAWSSVARCRSVFLGAGTNADMSEQFGTGAEVSYGLFGTSAEMSWVRCVLTRYRTPPKLRLRCPDLSTLRNF